MEQFRWRRDEQGRMVVSVPWRGTALLRMAIYNKGSAYSLEEREKFGLNGLLPPRVSTLAQQVKRVYGNVCRAGDDVGRHMALAGLHDRNEVLFYRLLLEHLEEFMPIVYTPTVGQRCQEFSHLFRRPRGIWITPADKGRIYEVLGNAPFADVRLIVATDNERILGLGDQGCGGMGIPVGKLALYTVAAGIHPSQTLPISLDVGTDNPELRGDEMYLGTDQPRLRGPAYDELIEEFVTAVRRRFPKALLQWEDFKQQTALDLLDRYRNVLPSFNDDVQGTAAVAVAGVLSAARVTGIPLQQQRIVILGAGAAGIGIARQLRGAMKRAGLSGDALTSAIAVLDSGGLLIEGRNLRERAKQEFVWPAAMAAAHGLTPDRPGDLRKVVDAVRTTVLIGTSGQPGVFTEAIVRAMASYVERPVVLPFSNPTANAEAVPGDLIRWTDGRALVATGSPFPPVQHNGRMTRVGQGNNVFIFPGVGLGVLVSEAKCVTDEMFAAAAETLAACVTDEDLAAGALYPRVSQLRAVSARIAEAVIREAPAAGGKRIDDIPAAVRDAMWTPEYPILEPAEA